MSENVIQMFASIEERDAEIVKIKDWCRNLIADLDRHVGPGRLAVMPMWVDGTWGDYWYLTLDGEDIGGLYYDGFGPVPKGDKLGALLAEMNN